MINFFLFKLYCKIYFDFKKFSFKLNAILIINIILETSLFIVFNFLHHTYILHYLYYLYRKNES